MDQSTQVNFPIVDVKQYKKMRRHNTSFDLYVPPKGPHLSNSLGTLRNNSRPKSLQFPMENLAKSKIFFTSELQTVPIPKLAVPSFSHSISDTSFGSISRERTPTFSCNSSTKSQFYNGGISNGVSSLPSDLNSPLSFPIQGQNGFPPPYNNTHGGHSGFHQRRRLSRFPEEDEECCVCREPDKKTLTAKGLSWRNLHMSRAKLKATSTTSELLSAFAMVAMVELQINDPTNVPEWLFVMFAVCTTVLVAVHIFALMISTYILPNIDAIAKMEVCELVDESPHERMRGFIELAWAFSTILGLFLFLVEVAILCWVKFWDHSFTAAIAATVVVIPVLIVFIFFAVHFYHSLVVFKCNSSVSDMQKLEEMKKQLDVVSCPV